MTEVLPLLGIWLLAVITPGPDFVVIVHHATSKSRRHGAMASFGTNCAILLWATGSMLGLSALLARLSWMYEIVRLAGACYLIYLGARMLWSSRHKPNPASLSDGPREDLTRASYFRSWRAGFLTNAANPKAIAFFGSLFGAFMPHHPSAALQVEVIAALVAMPAIWYLVVATTFGSAPVARLYNRARRWIDRVTATILILLGGRLAVDR